MTGGLRLRGDDGKVVSHKSVHETGLADIGLPYYADETGFMSHDRKLIIILNGGQNRADFRVFSTPIV